MQDLMEKIGYEFQDTGLLKTALTHSSYANEHNVQSYERLEFLGDSILSFIISTYLYKTYPDLPEGEMSKLRAAIVCERSLDESCRKFGGNGYIILSKGESQTGGRERSSIIADVFEAILGAIYLDGGIEPAQRFVMDKLGETIQDSREGHGVFKDYKTQLQEIVQHQEHTVSYSLVKEEGPEHNKRFTVQIDYLDGVLSTGVGKSKKDAEQNAAKKAIEELKKHGEV